MSATDAPERHAPAHSSAARIASHLLQLCLAVDPRGFFLTIATSIVGSLAEGFGLVLLLPLLATAGMNFSGANVAGRLGAAAQSALAASGIPHSLWLATVLALFLLTGTLRSMLRRTQSTLLYTTTNTIELALSRRVYAAVVHAQWGYLVRQRAANFTHILTEQLRKVTEAIALSLSLINLACLTLIYLALAFKLSVRMTLLVLALGLAVLLLQRASISRSSASGRALTASIGEVFSATEEHLLNLKSVKTYDAEERDIEMFSRLCRAAVENSIATARHQAGAAFRFETGSLIALAAVVFLALGVLHVPGATLLLLLGIFTRLMPQLAALQAQTHQFVTTLSSYEHILHIEQECLAHAEPALPAGTSDALALTRQLRVENLWFSYPPRTADTPAEPILRGLSLTLEPGTMTALAGPSGAGKSTLADILNGLLAPTSGRILLDGCELSPTDLRLWRRHVGYVGQETVLFHQSIRENLLWARPDATEADLHEALRLAAADFVHELPGGLDAIAGDRGILLSSGQRQRIALARALLRRPTLLILDEATNALDLDNESRILDALRDALATLGGRLTVLMVAHRSSALARADRVLYLESGVLADAPTPVVVHAEG